LNFEILIFNAIDNLLVLYPSETAIKQLIGRYKHGVDHGGQFSAGEPKTVDYRVSDISGVARREA